MHKVITKKNGHKKDNWGLPEDYYTLPEHGLGVYKETNEYTLLCTQFAYIDSLKITSNEKQKLRAQLLQVASYVYGEWYSTAQGEYSSSSCGSISERNIPNFLRDETFKRLGLTTLARKIATIWQSCSYKSMVKASARMMNFKAHFDWVQGTGGVPDRDKIIEAGRVNKKG